MRDLESQLRAWTDQTEPVTADDAVTEAESTTTTPFARPAADPSGRRRAWALLAAAILLVVGVAAFAFRGTGGDDTTPASPGPERPDPNGPEVVPRPTDPTVGTTTTEVPDTSGVEGRPSVLVGYTSDNRLVAIDPDTGALLRVLAEGFDAPDAPIEGGPFVVGDIAVDASRGRVLYGTCCEPAVGQIFAVDLEAGEPESFRFGDRPTLSPDGTELAIVEMQQLKIIDLATGDEQAYTTTAAVGEGAGRPRQVELVIDDLAWSPDSTQLLLVATDHVGGRSEVRLATFDGGSDLVFAARVLAEGPAEGERRVSLPRFGADGSISWIRQNVYDAVDGAAVEERIPADQAQGAADIGQPETTALAHEVRSRFVDGRGVEWRLSADGTVTEGGKPAFTVPEGGKAVFPVSGLRALAG